MLRAVLFFISIVAIFFGTFVNAQTYSQSFVAGTTYGVTSPQYTGWASFRNSLPDAAVTKITVSGSLDTIGRSCTDASVAQQIADALRTRTYNAFSCDGFTWRTASCSEAPGTPNDIELSVGAAGGCGCETVGYVLSPAILNEYWGGVNSSICGSNVTQTMTVAVISAAPEIEISSSAGAVIADAGIDAQGIEPTGTAKTVIYTVNNSGTDTLNLTSSPSVINLVQGDSKKM